MHASMSFIHSLLNSCKLLNLLILDLSLYAFGVKYSRCGERCRIDGSLKVVTCVCYVVDFLLLWRYTGCPEKMWHFTFVHIFTN